LGRVLTELISALQAVLANLLKYHVVAGTVVSSALSDGQAITSIATNGANTFKFVAAGTKLSPGPGSVDATITTADVLGTNGVVHVSRLCSSCFVASIGSVFIDSGLGSHYNHF
jgi:uncharacterized surface protein with fasciclin (FAS1) repeats